MPWLCNIAYLTLLTIASPVIAWRMLRHGRYRQGGLARLLGKVPDSIHPLHSPVWFHAVSVGEVIQLQKLIQQFQSNTGDNISYVVSTSTDSGYQLAVDRFGSDHVIWFPLDFTWAVRNVLSRLKPRALVLVELELWPNLIAACAERNVPVAVVNARISDQSFAGYSRFKSVLRPTFERLSLVIAQTSQYAERLRKLGVHADRVSVSGNLKFDGIQVDRNHPDTRQLKELFHITSDEVVFIAGSTQSPEESMILDAWQALRSLHSTLRLILVPRHPERFNDVANLVRQRGLPMVRRTTLKQHSDLLTSCDESKPIVLVDTIGELKSVWGLADIAFVGGSFGNRGGQNMLEPAAYGAAVMFGPNTKNFRDIVRRLLDSEAAVRLETPQDLAAEIGRLASDQPARALLGKKAKTCVLDQQGATLTTVTKLYQLLAVSSHAQSEAA